MKLHSALGDTREGSELRTNDVSASISGVDLFCGVGGLTHGLIRGGIRVRTGIDLDPQCRFPYESNNDAVFLEQNVHDLSGSELAAMFGDGKRRLLAGCAPCQPFSTYSRRGRQVRNDRKWELIADFGRLVRETQPDFVTMENVSQLLDHTVFKESLADLEDYATWYKVVNCAQYGIPQTRKRLVLLASRLGPVELISPGAFGKPPTTVWKAISRLPALEAGDADPDDPLHAACSLRDLNLRRIRASKPGGTWRDWDDELLT